VAHRPGRCTTAGTRGAPATDPVASLCLTLNADPDCPVGSGQAAQARGRWAVAPDAGDHVEDLADSSDLVCAEHGRTRPGGNLGGGECAVHALPDKDFAMAH
jgi:hypothetical protein